MRALPEVSAVDDPVRSADGRTVRVEVRMHGEVLQAKQHVDPLSAQTAGVAEAFPELDVAQAGDGTISQGLDGQRSDDLARTEMISLPVTLVVLALVFGSVMMVGVPVALAATSIIAAIGLAMLASHVFPDAGVGTNMILLIGLAVGVDYSLFVAKRERDERGRSGGRIDAAARVRIASATAGRTVVASGIAVVACAATLLVSGDVIFSSLAVGTIVVTAVAVLSSVTALPALLMLLGRRADRRLRRGAPAPARTGAVWTAVERVTGRRPTATLMVAVLGMAVLALPVLGIQLRELNRDTHSREIPVMRTYDRLTAAFPDRRPHLVVVHTPTAQQPAVTGALRDLEARYDPAATGTEIRWSGDGRTAVLALPMPYRLVSPVATESLQALRGELLPTTVGHLPEATYAVGGLVARGADEVTHQDEILPLVLALLAVTTVAVTAVTFRSLLLGVLGALLAGLSALAAFGVLVVFFQWGLASTVLGADPASAAAIGSRVPLFGVVILTALAIDYQFFVLGRVREAARAGASATDAVREGLRGVGSHGDQRGGRDGDGVRQLRAVAPGRDETDRIRARRRRPARRVRGADPDPARAAERSRRPDPVVAGRGTSGRGGRARPMSLRCHDTLPGPAPAARRAKCRCPLLHFIPCCSPTSSRPPPRWVPPARGRRSRPRSPRCWRGLRRTRWRRSSPGWPGSRDRAGSAPAGEPCPGSTPCRQPNRR